MIIAQTIGDWNFADAEAESCLDNALMDMKHVPDQAKVWKIWDIKKEAVNGQG